MTYRMALGAMAFALAGALAPVAVKAQDIGPAAGVYSLSEVDSQPLPIVTDIDDEGRCRKELAAADLTLRGNGTWSLVSRDRKVCYGGYVEAVSYTHLTLPTILRV